MRIHLLSDLHLEFADYHPAVTDADVTILAGDIAPKRRGLRWALEVFPGTVLYVPGNHEYYGETLDRGWEKLRDEAVAAGDRVRLLDGDEVTIDGVRFLGVTAWTDFELHGNSYEGRLAAEAMNDYKKIRMASGGRYRRLRTADTSTRARQARAWLADRLAEPSPGPTVVVTHHAPAPESVSLAVRQDVLSAAFANNWCQIMPGADLWCHGHTHEACDYRIGDTRVVSNPRGYPDEDTGFDPLLTIEVSSPSDRTSTMPDRAAADASPERSG